MIEGIESDDWYSSETARALRRHIDRQVDVLVASMRHAVASNSLTHAALCEGGIESLERLRHDITPPIGGDR